MDRCMSFAEKAIRVLHLETFLSRDVKTMEMVEALYRRQDKQKVFIEIWCRRLLLSAAAIGVAILVLVVCLCQEMPEDVIVDGNHLRIGSGQEPVTFGVEAETGAGMAKQEITLEPETDRQQEEEDATEATPDPREVLLSSIREAVESAVSSEEARDPDGTVVLPDTVSGTEVRYVNPEYKKELAPFYLCVALICLFPFWWKRQCEEKEKERDRQLMLDYPEMVNKIVLLLSAGLTVRGCFERICEEYRERMEEGGERRYVYEEVSFSFQEMKNGVSEPAAIEAFGKRCRLLPFLRFSSMVNQNIRKGSDGLIRLLETEAMEAFEKRKEQVKVMGETAGTKLLLPMMLMLGVVMAVIVIPAFMTM